MTELPNFSHAIMYHHFHSENHYKSQGSISTTDFEKTLDWLSNKYNLISADLYLEKYKNQKLENNDICLTFDDALKSQYDIALPVLNKRNLKAFFFIYSAPILGEADYLEIFRYYRSLKYKNIDAFYTAFFESAKNDLKDTYTSEHQKFSASSHLKQFDFYSDSDRWFRYLRDVSLGAKLYQEMMMKLMASSDISIEACRKILWMSEEEIQDIHQSGHLIGLHSYSHPTTMENLSFEMQKSEYQKNFNHIKGLIKTAPISMSHPCGKYNDKTTKILDELNIEIGFRSDLKLIQDKNRYELPRQDHTNIMRFLKN